MFNHFESGLNVKKFLVNKRPKLVVEAGCADGKNTAQLYALAKELGYKLVCVEDGHACAQMLPPFYAADDYEWHQDISYRFFPTLPDDSVDACVIDTDHNYWTLTQELDAIHPKLRHGALILLHDTVSFSTNHGSMIAYGMNFPYPSKDIEAHSDKGMGQAIPDFMMRHPREYAVVGVSEESSGAMALEKK